MEPLQFPAMILLTKYFCIQGEEIILKCSRGLYIWRDDDCKEGDVFKELKITCPEMAPFQTAVIALTALAELVAQKDNTLIEHKVGTLMKYELMSIA